MAASIASDEPIEPREDTPQIEAAAADAANANHDATEQKEEIANENPSFKKLVSMLNSLKPHTRKRGTRRAAMVMLENMTKEKVVAILRQMQKIDEKAVEQTETVQEEVPAPQMRTYKMIRASIKASNPNIKYRNLQKMTRIAFQEQQKARSPGEKKVEHEKTKAKSRMRNTQDDEAIVELLHDGDAQFIKLLNQMSNANLALKVFIEKKKIAMGLGRKNYTGTAETADQAMNRIHKNLESKFTKIRTGTRSRSLGRPSNLSNSSKLSNPSNPSKLSRQSRQSRANSASKPTLGTKMPGKPDARPGWMRNLGL
jgi:hypothetical protein